MFLIGNSSYAAVKAGSTCSKAGIKSVSAGKTYTCVKSGKKLVWNKGVLIPVAKPAPSASASAAPATSASPAPKASVAPAVEYPKGPTSFDDLVENYQGISYAAWSKSREKILSSAKTDYQLKMLVGPTTQLVYKEPLVPINLVTRLYAGYTQPAEINYLAFNFEDREWATKMMESTIPNAGSGWVSETACRTKETCWGGGVFFDGKNKFLVVVAAGIEDLNHTSGALDAHEFTHAVQQMNMKQARPPREFLFDPWPATWYWEGQARFTQHVSIYFENFPLYIRERRTTSGVIFQDSKFDSKHIEKFFVFNAPEEWKANYDRQRQYDLGAMFVEILVALKGPDSTMEMWKLCGTGMKFTDAFEKVYGTPYEKALPSMAKAIALELGRS
jgi:hypothetical protein